MPDRTTLLETFAALTDEALPYLLLAARPSAMTHGALTQIWPDGIGGFRPLSRTSIEDFQKAAEAYVKDLEAGK